LSSPPETASIPRTLRAALARCGLPRAVVPRALLPPRRAGSGPPGRVGGRGAARRTRRAARLAAPPVAAAVCQERAYLCESPPGEILRAPYGSQGFEESIAVAAYVRERTSAA